MPILSADNLEKNFGSEDTELFERVSCSVEKQDCIGLVGPNGSGKTTLFRILLGRERATGGRFYTQSGLTLGYLPQTPPHLDDRLLRDFLMEVFNDIQMMEKQLDELAGKMAGPNCSQKIIDQYTNLQHEFEVRDGYLIETRVDTVLSGLGFSAEQAKAPLSTLSGGWRTRAYLARLLLEEPDLLLLDEPTNHLDLEATRWLENFLGNWRKAVVIVSHDRFFLNKLCTRIWEMANGTLEVYRGNYQAYVKQREARYEEKLKKWEAQQKYIAETQDFIRRNIAGQRTKEAQGRRTRLERFMKREAIPRPVSAKNIKIQFKSIARAGDMVLRWRDLAIGYDGKLLAKIPDLELQRGQRLAIVGGNGTGKTTLVRTVLDELPAIAGTIRHGAQVTPGYLAQNHDDLNKNITALDAIREAQDKPDDGKARNLLGSLLFSGDDVFKYVGTLSGGERSRLALARLALRGANLLLLDEPTNHLDIASQEVLQSLLLGYPGTLILISHDRYLVQHLANRLIVFTGAHVELFNGTWDEYTRGKTEPAAQKQLDAHAKPKKSRTAEHKENRKNRNELKRNKRRFAAVEEEIHQFEDEKVGAEISIGKASEAQDIPEVERLSAEFESINTKLTQLYAEWEQLAEAIGDDM